MAVVIDAGQKLVDSLCPKCRATGRHWALLNGNLASRNHHLLKTFWGWTEKQLADGTLILTSPAGQTYVTTPGSALLFPSLCYAVGGMPTPEIESAPERHCGDRSAMMPKRRRTRTKARAHRVATERRANHQARLRRPPPPDDEPPPF